MNHVKPRYLIARGGTVLKDASPQLMKELVQQRGARGLGGAKDELDYVLRFSDVQQLRDSAAAWLREISRFTQEEIDDAWAATLRIYHASTGKEARRELGGKRKLAFESIAQKYDVLLGRTPDERPEWQRDEPYLPPGNPPALNRPRRGRPFKSTTTGVTA